MRTADTEIDAVLVGNVTSAFKSDVGNVSVGAGNLVYRPVSHISAGEVVDGIITDRPWVLREFLETKGEKLIPASNVDLPYHLEPDHIEAEDKKSESGRDAAY